MATFGLDIGTQSIKAVELEKHGENFSIVAAGITPSPQRGISSDSDQDLQAVSQSIKKLVVDTKITTHRVNISLPESMVFTRLVKFPYLNDEELKSAIAWQSEPHIPIPIADASVDYQVVKKTEPQNGQGGSVDVLLVAAPKSLVAKYMKVATLAGLTVAIFETELLALSRSLFSTQPTVIVDIGHHTTKIGVVVNGQVLVSRTINTAGQVLTRAVAQGLSVSIKQAEQYKKTYGLSQDQLEGNVRNVLELPINVIADEIKKTIQYYKSEIDTNSASPITMLQVTGGGAGLPELVAFLAEKVGLEVLVGDPFGKIVKDERVTTSFLNWAPLYSIAIGLAQNEE